MLVDYSVRFQDGETRLEHAIVCSKFQTILMSHLSGMLHMYLLVK